MQYVNVGYIRVLIFSTFISTLNCSKYNYNCTLLNEIKIANINKNIIVCFR